MKSVQNTYSSLWCKLQNVLNTQNIPREILEEMAANLAHGIRNPLAGIANFVSLLSDEVAPTQSPRISKIKEGVQHIELILENLITFSKPIHPYYIKCNFIDIIHAAVDSLKKTLNNDQVRCCYHFSDEEVYAEVDPELIKQALRCVVQNAIEAMPVGGEVAVSLFKRTKANKLIVTVRDQGIGLKDADINKLFYPFYTTKANGMGLGLALSKMYLEKHSGEISLKRNANKGVTVELELPLGARGN
ncbi:MAG: sensor histidine kinase [bacterium]